MVVEMVVENSGKYMFKPCEKQQENCFSVTTESTTSTTASIVESVYVLTNVLNETYFINLHTYSAQCY